MSPEQPSHADPRIAAAIAELRALVQSQYPTATFVVEPSADDPVAVHLIATVDIDDPDDVVDLTIERELALQLEDGIPVHVIPVRTPERVETLRRRERSTRSVQPVYQQPHASV